MRTHDQLVMHERTTSVMGGITVFVNSIVARSKSYYSTTESLHADQTAVETALIKNAPVNTNYSRYRAGKWSSCRRSAESAVMKLLYYWRNIDEHNIRRRLCTARSGCTSLQMAFFVFKASSCSTSTQRNVAGKRYIVFLIYSILTCASSLRHPKPCQISASIIQKVADAVYTATEVAHIT